MSGAHHNVTGPTAEATAVSTVRSVNRSCSTAAACAPSEGISLVLARPATGALAIIASAMGSRFALAITIGSRQLCRIGTEEIGQPQPPHQHHGAQQTMFPPASTG